MYDDSECFDWDQTEIIRAKWMWDGCSNLDEVIQRLHEQIEYIKKLKDKGWVLINPIEDDYGYIVQQPISNQTPR